MHGILCWILGILKRLSTHKGHGVSTGNAEFKKSMIVKIKSVSHIFKKTDNNRECEVLPKNKLKIMLDFCLVLYMVYNRCQSTFLPYNF